MNPSLVWGERRGGGAAFRIDSPLDGEPLAEGELLGDLGPLFRADLPERIDLEAGAARLAASLRARREAFVVALRRETGFVPRDCEEMVDGSLAYAEGYAAHPSTALLERREAIQSERRMRLVDLPMGTVAAILPHNAFLALGLSCGLNGLRAGNRVILRAPQQSALSASLFAEAVAETPEIAPWLAVAVCSARPFVEGFFRAPIPGLLHFFGGSKNAADLIARGFEAGKSVLIDGEGNAWAYVDRDVDPQVAATILAEGALRYNGQTCTSLNGAVVHPDVYPEVLDLLVLKFREASYGPLFDAAQAKWCLERVRSSGGNLLAGGERDGALLTPTLVENPDEASELVRDGLFGPALWIAEGDANAFVARWRTNRYPLCAAVLGQNAEAWAARLPNLARLVVNGDPSVEDPFEFWGGYPPSGQNPVSLWPAKYRRVLQVDTAR